MRSRSDSAALALQYLQALEHQRRLSPATLRNYERAIDLLLKQSDMLEALEPAQVRRFIAMLHAKGASPRTLALTLSAWRGYFRWLARHHGLRANPALGIRAPKAGRPLPKALSVEYLQRHHQGKLPPGLLRALTPGAADAWFTALARYGTMRFSDVVAPAIALAERGFPMYRYLATAVQTAPETYRRYPGNAAVFLPNGRPPVVGELFYQKDLAATLRQLVAVEEAHREAKRGEEMTLPVLLILSSPFVGDSRLGQMRHPLPWYSMYVAVACATSRPK